MPDTPSTTFAQTLEGLMLARGLSQAKLAEALGVYDGNVRRWRTGKGIEIENVWKIADYFGVERAALEQLAGYGDNSLSLTKDNVSPDIAAMLDSERAAVAKDLSSIPPAFHTSVLNAQRVARRLAIDLANAAIELTHGTSVISTPADSELASPELPPGQIERRVQRRRNEPLAPAFRPAVAY